MVKKVIDKIFTNNKMMKDGTLNKKLTNESKVFINEYISSVSVYLVSIIKENNYKGDIDQSDIDNVFKTL